jgi:hypothetical protein
MFNGSGRKLNLKLKHLSILLPWLVWGISSKPVSFNPEMALFRNLCVNLRNYLCGVPLVRIWCDYTVLKNHYPWSDLKIKKHPTS